MRQFAIGLFGLLIVALAGIAGCGDSGGKVVAQVGDRKITLDEFNDYIRNLKPKYPSAQAEFDRKKAELDSLVIAHLLIQAAYEKGIDKSEEVARVVLANRPKFLLDALYKKHISDQVSVSEAEIQEFYDKLQYKLRAYQVLLKDPDTAQMLFERLKNGADIEQVAYEYSIDPGAKRNRGDVGYFVWGAMVDEFQEAAFNMEPGEISPPVKSDYGYHIIKLINKTTNEMRGSYNEMKENIKDQILRRKRYRLMQAYMDNIKEKYPITVEQSTCDYVMHKREQLYPPQLLSSLPKSDFDIEQLDRSERELVLASWEGGQVSLFDYLRSLKQIPARYRPDLDDYDSVAVVVFSLKQTDILTYEAIKEGLESDPDFKKSLDRYKDLVMAQIMKQDSIPSPDPVDERQARKYYEEHPSEFSNPSKIHVYEIMVSDELQARRLAKEIKSLQAFKKKAGEITERPGKRVENGDLGYIERDWFPEIFDRAWKTPIGGIGGPVKTLGKYSIFYVVDRIPEELKDFLAVKRDVMIKLNNRNKGQAYIDWVTEHKKQTSIEEYPELLWETIDRTRYASSDTSGVGGK